MSIAGSNREYMTGCIVTFATGSAVVVLDAAPQGA